FFQAEDGIRDKLVTGVQTCALPIYDIAAFAIEILDPFDVLVDKTAPGDLVGGHLLRHTRVQVGRLLAVQQHFLDLRASQNPAQRSEERRVGKETRARCTTDMDTTRD